MSTGLDEKLGTFTGKQRKLARDTERAADAQKLAIAKAEQREGLRLAEAEGDIAKRRGQAAGKGAGRGSLIKSSPVGLAQNLGGTA